LNSQEKIVSQTNQTQVKEKHSGILSYLGLQNVGPAEFLEFEPEKRINLITGDNGLGKSFLLETAWWALTGEWLDYPADPTRRNSIISSITYHIEDSVEDSERVTIEYDQKSFSWPIPEVNQPSTNLIVYARADNSFAIWDPTQHYQNLANSHFKTFQFSPADVWFGLEDATTRHSICEGLLRDWVIWQNTNAPEFTMLTRVLKHLSPEDIGELQPSEPTRVPNERRLIPTLRLPYGDVAVIYASEGIKRIISLAYLLVWVWSEHKTTSQLAGQEPQRQMVLLVDELEAHLHPKWQRLILPALIDVQKELSKELDVQFLVATHSPLVMTSVEPIFNTTTDKIFNLDLAEENAQHNKVQLKEIPFQRYGVADSWLMSDVFELGHPRASQVEHIIEQAKQIQLQDVPETEEVQTTHNRLVEYLAADDEFWPRWLFFAEEHGVEL